MKDVDFIREYVRRLPQKLKTHGDMQVRTIVNGGKIPVAEMYSDSDIEKINLSHIEAFVYKFCRDNQKSFEPRSGGTTEWN